MPDQLITCPNCGNDFEVGDVLSNSIRTQLRTELEADVVKKQEEATKRLNDAKRLEKELAERAEAIDDAVAEQLEAERENVATLERERVEKELKGRLDDLHEQIEERSKKLEEANKRERELLKRQRELQDKEQSIDLEIERRLKEVATAERERVENELKGQLGDLQEQVDDRSKKLEEANKRERDLLRRQRELLAKEQSIDLEIERRLQEAQTKLFDEALRKAQETQQLKIREKDDLIERLKGDMQHLQRRMEQGSQEGQGEALEGQLLDCLSVAFRLDDFEEVKKGVHGADIVQTVRNRQGRVCGTILWEAKNARNFQNSWLDKLKQDQMEAAADIAVLMTVALPSGIKLFGQSKDEQVWITNYASAIGLCSALRQQLQCVTQEKIMVERRGNVKDILFEYVTSQEFKMRVRAMANTFIQMQQDLASEKRALQRQWKKREKQITMVLDNIDGMSGEFDGMVGPQAALPGVDPLSLDHLAADEVLDEGEEDAVDDEQDELASEEMTEEQGETEDEESAEDRDEMEVPKAKERTEPKKDTGKWWGRSKDRFFRE